MNRTPWLCIVLVLCAGAPVKAAPESAEAVPAKQPDVMPSVQHVPLNEVLAGEVVLTFFFTAPDQVGRVFVHIAADADHPRELAIEVRRSLEGYVARIPVERVTLPAFRYFVDRIAPDGSEHAVFASRDRPQRVRVMRAPGDELEHERLAERDGKRSTIALRAEAVDYGSRKLTAGGPSLRDRYYQLEAAYVYSVLTHIEDISLRVLRVRGEGGQVLSERAVNSERGIDAGSAAITFRLFELVRLRGMLLLGASQSGFEYGGGASLILGDPREIHLELAAEAIRTLGESARLRMGFDASPRFPMGATIEVSSFPIGADAGVRLLYDVGYRFDPVTAITLRAGYQGRTSITGGPSLAANLTYGF